MKSTKLLLMLGLSCCTLTIGSMGFAAAKAAGIEAPVDKMGECLTQVDGASVRYGLNDNKNGLSFMLSMTKENYENVITEANGYTNVTYGVLIAPYYYTRHYDLNFQNVFSENAKYCFDETGVAEGKKQIINCTGELTLNDTEYKFRGSVVDIYEENIGLDFKGVGYAHYTFNGEEKYCFLENTNNIRSMAYVAENAVVENNTKIESTKDEAIIADLTAKNNLLKTNYLDRVSYKLRTQEAKPITIDGVKETLTLPQDQIWFASENTFYKNKFEFKWYLKSKDTTDLIPATEGMDLSNMARRYILICRAERIGTQDTQIIYTQDVRVSHTYPVGSYTGYWTSDRAQYITKEEQADGSILFSYDKKGDFDAYGGLYFQDYYNNKGTDAYSSYKFIRVNIELLGTTTCFSLRINDSAYWKKDINIGDTLPEDVYLYIESEGKELKAKTLEKNVNYILYVPVSSSDNWDTIYVGNKGTENGPAQFRISNLEYTTKNENIRPNYLYVSVASGSAYPTQLSFLERLPDGNLLYTNTSAGDPENTADLGWSGLYVEGIHRIAGSYEKMEIKIGKNTTSVSINNENDLREIKVGSDASLFPARFHLYNMDGTKATSFERDVWYTLYLPIGGWNEIMINGGSPENPAEMYVGLVDNVSALPQ